MANHFKPGDRLRITFPDGAQPPMTATVTGFENDQSMGFSPEVEDYVSYAVDLRPDGAAPGAEPQRLLRDADGQYSLGGQVVAVTAV